jgi:uncharacterized phage-like protein YoqJ
MLTACFTGHRPNKLNGYNAKDNKKLLWGIHNEVVNLIENRGVTTFINGLALGVDMWSAKIVIKLKEKYPHIKLISAIPCRNHPNRWPQASKNEWQYICDNSDEVVLVSDEEYQPYLMQVRNEWMCDKSDLVIAVWDGTPGGTGNCVKYAESKNKEIVRINPNKLK